jgi:hypothetical protein
VLSLRPVALIPESYKGQTRPRDWSGLKRGGGVGPNLCVGVTARVVPLEVLFCGLKFHLGRLAKKTGECFIAKIIYGSKPFLVRSGVALCL